MTTSDDLRAIASVLDETADDMELRAEAMRIQADRGRALATALESPPVPTPPPALVTPAGLQVTATLQGDGKVKLQGSWDAQGADVVYPVSISYDDLPDFVATTAAFVETAPWKSPGYDVSVKAQRGDETTSAATVHVAAPAQAPPVTPPPTAYPPKTLKSSNGWDSKPGITLSDAIIKSPGINSRFSTIDGSYSGIPRSMFPKYVNFEVDSVDGAQGAYGNTLWLVHGVIRHYGAKLPDGRNGQGIYVKQLIAEDVWVQEMVAGAPIDSQGWQVRGDSPLSAGGETVNLFAEITGGGCKDDRHHNIGGGALPVDHIKMVGADFSAGGSIMTIGNLSPGSQKANGELYLEGCKFSELRLHDRWTKVTLKDCTVKKPVNDNPQQLNLAGITLVG